MNFEDLPKDVQLGVSGFKSASERSNGRIVIECNEFLPFLTDGREVVSANMADGIVVIE